MRDTSFSNGFADDGWRFDPRFADEGVSEPPKPASNLVLFYGDVEPEPPPFLVQDLLPQTQTAILAGQWGVGKTFLAIDLALAIMLGLDFAGRKVVRKGAVLWLAAEGVSEVEIRLKAAAIHRTGDDQKGKLPFCRQAADVPSLTDPESMVRLMAIVAAAEAGLAERFGEMPLSLIVVDTLNSAANFEDQNNGSEAQRVMSLCRRLSDQTGALVLLIDHFGKNIETGVEGSSDKSNAADAILSALADKSDDGSVGNRRLAVFKLRSGRTGDVFPFKLKQVEVNEWGTPSCAVEWGEAKLAGDAPAQKEKAPKPDWSGNSRVFRSAMVHAMIDRGSEQRPFGFERKPVKAVTLRNARAEFYKRYPAENEDAKKKQFARDLKRATALNLIASREIGGEDWLWFLKDADALEIQMSKTEDKGDTGGTSDIPL